MHTESGVRTKIPKKKLVPKLFLSCLIRAPPEVLTELSLNELAWTSTAGFSISPRFGCLKAGCPLFVQ